MRLSIVVMLAAALFATAHDISITGNVDDGKDPLAGAVVSLASDSTINDTTGADGAFKLGTTTAILAPSSLYMKKDVQMGIQRTSLTMTLSRHTENGAISLYNVNGTKIIGIPLKNLGAQTYQIALPVLSSGVYMLSLRLGSFTTFRRIIYCGGAFHLDGSGHISAGDHESLLAKMTQEGGDSLKVKKEGYITQAVALTSYQVENMHITLQKMTDGPCNGGRWATTDVTKKGPFETVTENVDVGILYRPKEMLAGCLYPVITWGHGAGGSPSNYTTVLAMVASHGFVVIASSAGNVQDGGNAGNQFRNKMVEGAEWVVKQNSNSSSVLYQKINTEKIGAAGHSQGGYGASEAGQNPLITTSVSISGAVGSSNQKGPAFIICGGKDSYSGARCEDHPSGAYNGTSGVPVFFGKCLDTDHGNWGFEMMLADKSKPSDVVQAMTAWFRYFLMGDEVYRSWFYGADCHLCNHANWSVQRKGMD